MYYVWRQSARRRLPFVAWLRQSTLAETMQTLWPYLRKQRRRLLLAYGNGLVLTALEVSAPVLIGLLVDRLHQAGSTALVNTLDPSFIAGICLLLLLAIAQGRVLAHQHELNGQLGERVAEQMRNTLWNHVQHIPLGYTRQRGAGRLLVRFLADTRAVQQFVAHGVVKLPHSLLLGLTILVVLLLLSPLLALVVILVVPIYLAVFQRLNPALQEHSRVMRRRRTRLSAYLNERITGLATVKAHRRQPYEAAAVRKLTRSLARNGARLARTRGYLEGLTTATVAFSTALVLGLAAFQIQSGELSSGQMLTFYALLGLLLPTFRQISTANRVYQETQISLERLRDTLRYAPEGASAAPARPLVLAGGTVCYQEVVYAYGPASPVLNGINFLAQRGEIVALVGPNGAGKSTLVELLLRFLEPQQGCITIDEQDIAQVDLPTLRAQIGLVTQEVPLFAGSIADNIAYGLDNEADSEQLATAARLAGIAEMIAALPQGWDTPVGPGGHALSGGQRQRIALARALVNNPPILVLDEPSAALDAAAEHALAHTLRDLARTRTVMVVAHRLATLVAADRIYVLDQGNIVQVGTHADLLQQPGVYARLYGELVFMLTQQPGYGRRAVLCAEVSL